MCVERFGIFALVGFLAFVGNGVAQVVEAVPGAETAVDSPSAEVHPESDVPTDEQPAFLRLERDEHGQPHAMQTAITRFQPKAGFEELTVDLVAALHIGDKEYYEQLNQQLANYDVVLYELVAPKGTVIPKGGGRGANDPISALQDLARQVGKGRVPA